MGPPTDILDDSILATDDKHSADNHKSAERTKSRTTLVLERASSLPLIAALLAPLSTLLDIPAMTVSQYLKPEHRYLAESDVCCRSNVGTHAMESKYRTPKPTSLSLPSASP